MTVRKLAGLAVLWLLAWALYAGGMIALAFTLPI